MSYTQFSECKFDCLEIISFLTQGPDDYCIWYSDEVKDGFLTQNNDLLTFATQREALEFIRSHTSYHEPVATTIYDIHKIKQMADQLQPFDACEILEFWNIAGDLANSVNASFRGDLQDDLTNQIYEKLFYGNNLPEINTSGKIYIPQFTEEECLKLHRILLDGISVITNVSKVSPQT